MINTLNENIAYNPIRSHIAVSFSYVNTYEEKIELIANDLLTKQFDGLKSRVLIFVSYRYLAEEAADKLRMELKNKKVDYWEKVDYYHAGLEGAEREEKFESYKNGEILILITTKAFGMGMDIPNVHYIYHLNPSSNFEDFLQEIGRAGRNEAAYLAAGFSIENPIKTNCIIAKDDFKKTRDKLKETQTSWSHVIQIEQTLHDYISKFWDKKSDENDAFPLPTDLLYQYAEYSGKGFDETFFRVILYWLEKLKKIKLGTFTPTHIPLSIATENQNYSLIKETADVTKIKELYSKLKLNENFQNSRNGFVMVDMLALQNYLSTENKSEIWRLLFLAQKAKSIKIERKIFIASTIKRKNELERWSPYNTISPIIECVFAFATKIMYASKYNQQVHFSGDELDSIILEEMHSFINPNKIFWKEYFTKNDREKSKEEIALSVQNDFKEKRAKFAFKLINFLPEGKHKSILQVDKVTKNPFVTQLIFNGYKKAEIWEQYLLEFKKDLYELIKYINNACIKLDIQKHNIVDLLIELNLDSKGEDYFKQLIFIAKALGFLKGNDTGLVPMGVELFMKDHNQLDNDNLSEFEESIKLEFEESIRMKDLRLLALECLSDQYSVTPNKYDEFIKSYFQCSSEIDFVKLLEEYLGQDHESLSAFRAKALENAIASLNPDQEKVYKAHINENLQVIAGPGSGKTHTLTLRVARLIQDENVNPENILVLAYNRAVVIELKDRLYKLFRKLGYAKLISKLKVFTFHGFCKYVLKNELEGLEFDKWVKKFLDVNKTNPGTITQGIGSVKYVFVDEFQDITLERLELLKVIAKPKKIKICVIGDPNQSIYGFERVKEGGEMNPQKYYDEFAKIYKPSELYLSINYRSYASIIEEADRLLSLNETKFDEMPSMSAHHVYKGETPICQFFDLERDKTDWKNKLKELLEYQLDNGEGYLNVAVMFRSNNEVYRAFNEVKKIDLPNVRVRVQGASGSLNKTREFYYFLSKIKNKSEEKLPTDYFSVLMELKRELISELPNWDEYLINVFLCIAFEYLKEMDQNSSYFDLFNFINDLSSKDDGQFAKLYQQNIHKITDDGFKREIVLTTMHKVKGIEYDAVLIPPSLSNFAINSTSDTIPSIDDVFEEERRLYYVAYTRAKYRLVVIKWKKENALYNTISEPIEIFKPEEVNEKMGILMEEGIDKFTLYWGASDFGRGSFETIKNHVRIGDEVLLKEVLLKNDVNGTNNFRVVYVNHSKVAQLRKSIAEDLSNNGDINGYIVSSVYVHTYEETVRSDEEFILNGGIPSTLNGRPFANKWKEDAKQRGFIYLIDFSGFGKIIN